MMMGSTPSGEDSASQYINGYSNGHLSSSSSDDEKHSDPVQHVSVNDVSYSENRSMKVKQVQCFACLRMNDPELMHPHKFIHPSYFADVRAHRTSLCVACYQCMGLDQLVNQSNSHLVRRCDWTVDRVDNHYAQCSGCGCPNRKNNTCETCPGIFCDACIRSFGGPKLWWKVENVDYWQCLAHERRPEWTNDCDLFTVPHARCRLERGDFTTITAVNPMPYESIRLSSNAFINQRQSLLMVAGLTYHTPLVKRNLAYHLHDVADLCQHLHAETLKRLQTENAVSMSTLKSIPLSSSNQVPINVSPPLKLISVSLYHKTACRPDEHRRYIVGLMENLQTFTSVWKGWTVRIYYDSSMLVPASSPLEGQDSIDPADRVIETVDGLLTINSKQTEFVWDHSKYTAHLISAWQIFMSWARDQPHIQLCYFNWPHLQDAEGFHLRHVGMLARFLALAEIGVTATHVVIADLDNLWTAKARDKAENFKPETARFHRYRDWSYPWDLMGGGFSVRWPANELKPDDPASAPFHDIEYAIHEFAQGHFSAPHEFYKMYRPGIEASCRSVGKGKKGLKNGKKHPKKKASAYNGEMIIDGDFAIAELTHTEELDGRMEDELFGYCVDQAFLARIVWARMKQLDATAIAPGWIITTPTRVKNVPQLPTVPEQTKIQQNQNTFVSYFDMLTQARWPACYHLEKHPQYKNDDSLSWQSPLLGQWMKKECRKITMKQSKKEWKPTPFDAKSASAPLHYYSYVVDSRVRMVNSMIDYLGRLTTHPYISDHAVNQQFSHHPFIGIPSLSSSLVHDHHAKCSHRPDQGDGILKKNRKHDWVIRLIHDFVERKRSSVQKAISMQQSIHHKIFGTHTGLNGSAEPFIDTDSFSYTAQRGLDNGLSGASDRFVNPRIRRFDCEESSRVKRVKQEHHDAEPIHHHWSVNAQWPRDIAILDLCDESRIVIEIL